MTSENGFFRGLIMDMRAVRKTIVVSMVLGSIVGLRGAPQEPAKKNPETRPISPSGAELYKQHCLVCHGNDLKGVGPALEPYRVPPDLSKLALRHNGKFPAAYVADVLRNGVILPAHGPAEMPIWGTDFREMHGFDKAQVDLRIANLTNYIKSQQAK